MAWHLSHLANARRLFTVIEGITYAHIFVRDEILEEYSCIQTNHQITLFSILVFHCIETSY